MNYFSYFLFLGSLAGLSLMMLALLRILVLAKVASRQKITVLKIGLLLIAIAPFIFTFLRLFSWHTIAITLPGKFINRLLTHTTHIILTEPEVTWGFYIFAAYGVIFFAMLSRILFSYVSARKQLAGSLPVIIQGQLVFINRHIKSPLSFGFPTAKIYFPANAGEKWTPREIQMSLAHEKIHLERNDAWWKLLSLCVQALLFFVPWSYSLHRKLELEMEIFCDMRTCAETAADIKEYGCLLLAMTCRQPQNLIFTNMTDSTLKRRLLAMKTKTRSAKLLVAILSSALLLAGSTAIAMTSGITEKKSSFNILSKIFLDGELISSPRIVIMANQPASIEIGNKDRSQDLRIKLVSKDATMSGIKNAISISYDIRYQNGEEKMHSKPQIIIAPGQEGRVSLSSDSGHTYEMRVVAERD